MTPLQKPVTRRATFTRDAGRLLVVTLHPGDVIGLRLYGTRREYTTTIGAVYSVAVKAELARRKAERAKARKGTSKRR
jgi:hypothetical protein